MIEMKDIIEGYRVSVTLTPELRLEQALKQAGINEPKEVTHLTVSGIFTDEDDMYLKNNSGKYLLEVDYSNCTSLPSHLELFSIDNLRESGFITMQEYMETHPSSKKSLPNDKT